MIRRLLTALLPIAALAACGMPEEGEWVDEGSTDSVATATYAAYVAEEGQPAAASEPSEEQVAEDENDGTDDSPEVYLVTGDPANPTLILVSGGGYNPGGTASSTQDPIPAKNRHDPFATAKGQ
jgi:hypothetical protein